MKRSVLGLLRRMGALELVRHAQRARSVVLTYHGVLSGADDSYQYLNQNFVAAQAFEQQVRFLRERYRPIRLADLIACYECKESPPPRSLALTFDDGFANNYTVAFPILQKYEIPFTIFLTTGMLNNPGAMLWTERAKRTLFLARRRSVTLVIQGHRLSLRLESSREREEAARRIVLALKRMPPAERDPALTGLEEACGAQRLGPEHLERYQFLSWSEVRAMAAQGVEFGSHSVSHPILSTLHEVDLEREIGESKRAIEAQICSECYAFAYPNGSPLDFGPREQASLRTAGYRCAFALNGSLNDLRTNLYALDRVNISREFDGPLFEAAVSGVLSRLRKLRASVRGIRAILPGSARSSAEFEGAIT